MDSQDDRLVAEPEGFVAHGDVARGFDAEELAPPAPTTGDPAIDSVIAELTAARQQPFEAHIAAGEKAHRVLQARLSDLGGE